MPDNNNKWITKFLVGALWTVVIGAIMFTGKNVISNDQGSRDRDTAEACQRELVNREVIRLDANQVEVIKKVDKILDNQDSMVKLLTRLETKIERIQ